MGTQRRRADLANPGCIHDSDQQRRVCLGIDKRPQGLERSVLGKVNITHQQSSVCYSESAARCVSRQRSRRNFNRRLSSATRMPHPQVIAIPHGFRQHR